MAFKRHQLKTWPEYFHAVRAKQKTFEVRKKDRDFEVGDTLELKEYDPTTDSYTGKAVLADISYILDGGNFGVEAGYCVLGLDRVTRLPSLKDIKD